MDPELGKRIVDPERDKAERTYQWWLTGQRKLPLLERSARWWVDEVVGRAFVVLLVLLVVGYPLALIVQAVFF